VLHRHGGGRIDDDDLLEHHVFDADLTRNTDKIVDSAPAVACSASSWRRGDLLVHGAATSVSTGRTRAVDSSRRTPLDTGASEAFGGRQQEVVEICTSNAQKDFNIFLTVFLLHARVSRSSSRSSSSLTHLVACRLSSDLMANAGGAWDNAKKIVEVELKQKGTRSTRRRWSATRWATVKNLIGGHEPCHQIHDTVRAAGGSRWRVNRRASRGRRQLGLSAIFFVLSLIFAGVVLRDADPVQHLSPGHLPESVST